PYLTDSAHRVRRNADMTKESCSKPPPLPHPPSSCCAPDSGSPVLPPPRVTNPLREMGMVTRWETVMATVTCSVMATVTVMAMLPTLEETTAPEATQTTEAPASRTRPRTSAWSRTCPPTAT